MLIVPATLASGISRYKSDQPRGCDVAAAKKNDCKLAHDDGTEMVGSCGFSFDNGSQAMASAR